MTDSPETGPVRVEVFVEINGKSVDDVVEIPRAEWQAMTPQQRRATCQSLVDTHLANTAPSGYQVLDADAGSDDDPEGA